MHMLESRHANLPVSSRELHPGLVSLAAMITAGAYLFMPVILGHVVVATLLWSSIAAGTLGLVTALMAPARRHALVQTLAVTSIVFFALRIAHPWIMLLRQLPLGDTARFWIVDGPGGGLLGFLPSALLILWLGRRIFHVPVAEQWGGSRAIQGGAWRYGALAGAGLALVTLGLATTFGAGPLRWAPPWAGLGVNLLSNLYEEILVRGVLLQVVRRQWNDRTAMVWTGLVFGLMHGWDAKAIFIMLTSWVIAWAVIRARSLWAGWIAHQVADLLVDSLLH